jgi:biopolymer transport protein ExbD
MLSPVSKIDITPLVGVALILVIVFMVTSPLMMVPVDLNIELPKAKTVEAKSEKNITISISPDNILALNDREISFEDLENGLAKLLEKNPDRLVVIRADKNVKHKQVLNILTITKHAGARRLAIATLQRNRTQI